MADPSTAPPLTRASVQAAHELIAPLIHRTPVLTNSTLDRLASTPRTAAELRGTEWAGREPARPVLRFWFKCENLQRVGAFKARGAFHAVERLKREPGWAENGGRERGVVTHSSGNHAQALALAASASSIPCHIVMPSNSVPAKVAAVRDTYGARVTFSGPSAAEREAVTAEIIAKTGARLVPPYNHPDIILGQGTAALELQSQFSQLTSSTASVSVSASASPPSDNGRRLDAIITPCGGGGLLSGTALACAGTGTAVFGAEPTFEGADDCRRGLAEGRHIAALERPSSTVADGLRTPVGAIPWSIITSYSSSSSSLSSSGHPGSNPGSSDHAHPTPDGDPAEGEEDRGSRRRLVRAVYGVSEPEIRAALRLVYERMKLVVEPSAVVGLAAALYNEDFRRLVEREGGAAGWDVGVVLSGGNVSLEALGRLFADSS